MFRSRNWISSKAFWAEGDLEDEARLVLRPHGLEALVVHPARVLAGRGTDDFEDGGAGLEDGAAGVLPLPGGQPRQPQGLAVELQGAIEVHRAHLHAKLPDLHGIPLLELH